MKCTLAHFEYAERMDFGENFAKRIPVECGGEIKPTYKYFPDNSKQCDGYYCTNPKCGVRYEKLPEVK